MEMQLEFKVADRLVHKFTKVEGYFLRDYYPTGGARTLQIKCDDGRIFYGPYNEFAKVIK